MEKLNILMLHFCFLIVLIMILIFMKEFPSIDRNQILQAFGKI